MKTRNILICLSLVCTPIKSMVHAADTSATKPITAKPMSDDEATKYTATLDKRGQDVLDDLKLTDTTKAQHVKDDVIAQYRALRAWHDTYDDDLKALNKDQKKNADALAQIDATRVEMHNAFLAKLAEDLTLEQIEVVKDRMTYGTVAFTYKGYLGQYPNLTDEEKAKILEFLKEGREIAMDGGSQNEKATIFKKYKGKINIYLGQEKKKAAAASQPATQP